MRPTIEETMLMVAKVLSERSTCKKKKVGCVITDEQNRVLSVGYNGAPMGEVHCIDQPCIAWTNPNWSCAALHAEANAIMFCHDLGKIHTIYVTEQPCEKCLMMIKQTNCKRLLVMNTREQDYE